MKHMILAGLLALFAAPAFAGVWCQNSDGAYRCSNKPRASSSDVWVGEPRGGLSFAEQALLSDVQFARRSHHLERHAAPQLAITRLVHDAEPAATELAHELEPADDLPRVEEREVAG
jgi:hypothetical protein